jgi:hypothetical protein
MKNSAPIHLASSIASPPRFVTGHLVVLDEKMFVYQDALSSNSR